MPVNSEQDCCWLQHIGSRQSCAAARRRQCYFTPRNPHILSMATWQKTFTREPPKTKAELREMLTQASSEHAARAEAPTEGL
jgi:hypothetical protein